MRIRRATTLLGLVALIAGLLTTSAIPAAAKDGLAKRAAKGELRAPRIQLSAPQDGPRIAGATRERVLPFLSAAVVNAAREALGNDSRDLAGETGDPVGTGTEGDGVVPQVAAAGERAGGHSLGVAARSLGCSARNTDGNVRVNQDCTYRRQAEEIIKFNPAHPSNLIAGQNDSRVGYNHCGFDYSFDSGKTWGDGQPPFFQKENHPEEQEPTPLDPNRHTIAGGLGTAHTYDACSDPALAFDSEGRAFYSGILFDINSDASLLTVTVSPKGAGGSFYNNLPAHTRRYVVAEDNNPGIFHDKQFVAADIFAESPNRDNVYVTWTVFKADPRCKSPDNPGGQCESPIFGSMSTNHGVTWSTPEEISGVSDLLCPAGQIDPKIKVHACNQNQGSDPIVLPNGDLEVIFNNGNTALSNPNSQQLGVHCHPTGSSTAGTAHLNCLEPAKVGDDITEGEPLCNFGRGPEECIPGAFIRTNDFPRIAVNRGNGNLYATWQDYRTGEFDIQLSQSLDGGLTWHEAQAPVNPDRDMDHYFPAIDVVPSGNGGNGENGEQNNGNGGDHVGVSYYRTDRVANENATPPGGFAPCPAKPGKACQADVRTKDSDYSLAGGRGLNTPYSAKRISPRFPPPDGIQTGFNGDYSGLVVIGNEPGSPEGEHGDGLGIAHPIWSDTRNAVPSQFQTPTSQGVTRDEDIFTDSLRLPDGHGGVDD